MRRHSRHGGGEESGASQPENIELQQNSQLVVENAMREDSDAVRKDSDTRLGDESKKTQIQGDPKKVASNGHFT